MAQALRDGKLGVMDYYDIQNIKADTKMRDEISKDKNNNYKLEILIEVSSINKKSDLSRLFGLIENSLSIDTKDIKKVTDFFSLTDDKSANFRDDRGQINRQAQLNNQSQNTYKEKKLAEPKADNDERKQSIIEKTFLMKKK